MKTTTFFISVCVILAICNKSHGQFSIGPRFAVNLSSISTSNFIVPDYLEVDYKYYSGIAIGMVTEYNVTEIFSIQPELLFSQQGFREATRAKDEDYREDHDFRLKYFQIPILLKLKLGSDRLGAIFMAGPHFGFGLGSIKEKTTEYSNSGTNRNTDVHAWHDLDLRKFDFGLTGGAGLYFALGPGDLGFDVRYQFGLNNILLDDKGRDKKASNRNFQFGLSYLFNLGSS